MTALATLDELKARLDWELDADEERIATSALEDASEEARFYGAATWTDAIHPPYAKTLVLRACKRYMDNPSGYTQSRAGDETLLWSDTGSDMGTVHFTEAEKLQLARLAGKSNGLVSVPTTAWNTDLCRPRRAGERAYPRAGYVPSNLGSPFPLFSDPESPW